MLENKEDAIMKATINIINQVNLIRASLQLLL